MSTYLRAKMALLPLILFGTAALLGWPTAGAAAGLAFALAYLATRPAGRRLQPLFIGMMAALAIIVLAALAGYAPGRGQGLAILFAGLSAGAAASLVIGRPWTSEFSASEYADVAASPLFLSINNRISGLWAVLFGWLAVAAALALPSWASLAPTLIGALLSIVGPRLLMRRGLAAMAAGDRRNAWPAPDFSVRPSDEAEQVDVAIVGAGLGGLTAAALLAESGLQVAVFDQHDVPGGFAHNWLRRVRGRDADTGRKLVFRFDSGVHDVSGCHEGGTLDALFRRLGIADRLKWRRLDHRYVLDGVSIDVSRDWRLYVARLGELFPDQKQAIAALFDEAFAIYTAMFSTAAGNSGIPGTPSDADRLLAFARSHPLAVEWMDRPWDAFVSRHLPPGPARQLIEALSGYITHDPSTMSVADFVPILGYHFKGGHYPEGGSGRIADALVEVIERHGGKVHLRTAVRRILVRDGTATGVLVADIRGAERRIGATAVVSNADARATFEDLVADPDVTSAVTQQVGPLVPSCSALSVALGLRGALDIPPVVHVTTGDGEVGIVAPSVVDPSCAPEGYSNIELTVLVPHDEAVGWFGAPGSDLGDLRSSPAYLERKRSLTDQLIERATSVIPDLRERIVLRADASPVTYHRYGWSSGGAIYGVQPRAGRLPIRTPVRNLVLAGAATHGGGVEAVIISGALAADVLRPGILRRSMEPVALKDLPRPDARTA